VNRIEKPLKVPDKFLPLFESARLPTYMNLEGNVVEGKFWTTSDPLLLTTHTERARVCDLTGRLIQEAFVVDWGHLRTRYYVYWGGRGGAKSHQFAIAVVLRMMEEKIQVLCCREIQSSIADSVHRLIASKIAVLGLSDHFEILVNSIRCKTTGSEAAFRGLKHNLLDIKSFEGAKICWVEEATNVTEESWDVLIPTIRAPGSEIWVGFNTDLEDDPTYKHFVLEADDDMTVVEVSYLDNPFIDPVLLREALKMKERNYEKYQHIWLGKPRKAKEGGVFISAMINIVDAVPVGVTWVRGWDFAGTEIDPKAPESREPDWTRGVKLGRTGEGRYVIADMVSLRDKPHMVEQLLTTTAKNDGWSVEQSIPQDPGQAGKMQVQYWVGKMAGCRVHSSPETGDKVTRAEPFASQVNVGNVDMLRAPWNDEVLKELESFPNGTFKDITDALSRAFGRLLAPRKMRKVKITGK
jgi:predicted phage terminase large subunit-like protein